MIKIQFDTKSNETLDDIKSATQTAVSAFKLAYHKRRARQYEESQALINHLNTFNSPTEQEMPKPGIPPLK